MSHSNHYWIMLLVPYHHSAAAPTPFESVCHTPLTCWHWSVWKWCITQHSPAGTSQCENGMSHSTHLLAHIICIDGAPDYPELALSYVLLQIDLVTRDDSPPYDRPHWRWWLCCHYAYCTGPLRFDALWFTRRTRQSLSKQNNFG